MIQLSNVGKRFRYEWIFKNINYVFEKGKAYAILGSNGSGKSTLMKIMSGHLTPSVGEAFFYNNDKKIDADAVYKFVSYAAPYIDLIEEFTLTEMIDFHCRLKPLSYRGTQPLSTKDVIQLLDFQKNRNKEIHYFSSGMKQRLKLALAICSDTPFLLLDEPTTNLDAQGVAWYQSLVADFAHPERLVVVASNIEHDYYFCSNRISIESYKV